MSKEILSPITKKIIESDVENQQPKLIPVLKPRTFLFKLPTRKLFVIKKPQPVHAPMPVISQPVNYVVTRSKTETVQDNVSEKSACQRCCNSIPWWCWILSIFLPLALLGGLIYLLVTSPAVNPSYHVYKYVTGVNNYWRFYNRSEVHYETRPCIPEDLANSYENRTTPYPLCQNVSVSNITVYQYNREVNNYFNPPANAINFKCNQALIFFSFFFENIIYFYLLYN